MNHIVIVTSEFPPQPGGIGNHAYNLALHLSKSNYEVSVITDQRSMDGKEEHIFDRSLPFSIKRIGIKRLRWIMYISRLINTFKFLKQADQVIATGKFSLWNVAFCNIFFRRKSMAIVHGSEVNFRSKLIQKLVDLSLKRFHTIVAVSSFSKGLMQHLHRPIEVIPNGIEVSKWSLQKASFNKIKGNPVLTTVGRVSARKGQLNVIKHLPILVKDFPELHYHCIGIPTEKSTFIKKAEALGVAKYITFHGALDDNKLQELLSETDIFIMLSSESVTGDVEGFGIAILEANALGIPAIGAKGCGIEDAIKSGFSGILIDPFNVKDFKAGISVILEDKLAFSEKARKWAEAHDWSQVINSYIALLK